MCARFITPARTFLPPPSLQRGTLYSAVVEKHVCSCEWSTSERFFLSSRYARTHGVVYFVARIRVDNDAIHVSPGCWATPRWRTNRCVVSLALRDNTSFPDHVSRRTVETNEEANLLGCRRSCVESSAYWCSLGSPTTPQGFAARNLEVGRCGSPRFELGHRWRNFHS